MCFACWMWATHELSEWTWAHVRLLRIAFACQISRNVNEKPEKRLLKRRNTCPCYLTLIWENNNSNVKNFDVLRANEQNVTEILATFRYTSERNYFYFRFVIRENQLKLMMNGWFFSPLNSKYQLLCIRNNKTIVIIVRCLYKFLPFFVCRCCNSYCWAHERDSYANVLNSFGRVCCKFFTNSRDFPMHSIHLDICPRVIWCLSLMLPSECGRCMASEWWQQDLARITNLNNQFIQLIIRQRS